MLVPGMRGAGKMLGQGWGVWGKRRQRPGRAWGSGVQGSDLGRARGVPAVAEGAGAGEGLVWPRTPGMLQRRCRGAVFIPGLGPGSLLPEEPPALSPAPRGPRPRGFVYGLALFSEALAAPLSLGSRLHNLAPRGNLKPPGRARCPAVPRSLAPLHPTPPPPPPASPPPSPRSRPCVRHCVLPTAPGLARCS